MLINDNDLGKILKTNNITDYINNCFSSIVDFKNLEQYQNQIPPTPLKKFLLIRQLALKIPEDKKNNYTESLKNQWRRYYLKCCINEKCDYLFTSFKILEQTKDKKIKLDREKDIVTLLKGWDVKEMKGFVGSLEGVKSYYDICISYLLKRFSCRKVCEVLWDISKKWWALKADKIVKISSLWLKVAIPIRIIFGLLITNYFAISAKWLWALISKAIENNLIYTLTKFIFAVLSWLYLSFVECFPEIERDAKEAIKRGAIVWFWNSCWSTLIAWVLGYFVVLSSAREFITPGYGCKPIILYSQIVVFISLFIQHFWQEKTITEPY